MDWLREKQINKRYHLSAIPEEEVKEEKESQQSSCTVVLWFPWLPVEPLLAHQVVVCWEVTLPLWDHPAPSGRLPAWRTRVLPIVAEPLWLPLGSVSCLSRLWRWDFFGVGAIYALFCFSLASNYCYVCFLTKYTCFPYYLFRSPLWETVSPSKLSAIFWSCIDNCLLGMPSDFQICIIAI